jgi:hypothetical protein
MDTIPGQFPVPAGITHGNIPVNLRPAGPGTGFPRVTPGRRLQFLYILTSPVPMIYAGNWQVYLQIPVTGRFPQVSCRSQVALYDAGLPVCRVPVTGTGTRVHPY